jgi:hypothetical protein
MSGYISYLNRERDARTFSQPKIHHLNTDIADAAEMVELDKRVILHQYNVQMKKYMEEVSNVMKERKIYINQKPKDVDAFRCSDAYTKKMLQQCKELQKKTRKELFDTLKGRKQTLKNKLTETRGVIQELRAMKGRKIENIQENMNIRGVDTDIDKNTAYYKISRKCRLKPPANQKLRMFVDNSEEMLTINKTLKTKTEFCNSLQNQIADYKKSRKNTTKKMPKEIMENKEEAVKYKRNMEALKHDLNETIKALSATYKEEASKLKTHLTKKRKIQKKVVAKLRKTLKTRENEIIKNTKENEDIRKMMDDAIVSFESQLKELEEAHVEDDTLKEQEKQAKLAAKEQEKQAKLAAKEQEKQAKLAAKEQEKKR